MKINFIVEIILQIRRNLLCHRYCHQALGKDFLSFEFPSQAPKSKKIQAYVRILWIKQTFIALVNSSNVTKPSPSLSKTLKAWYSSLSLTGSFLSISIALGKSSKTKFDICHTGWESGLRPINVTRKRGSKYVYSHLDSI